MSRINVRLDQENVAPEQRPGVPKTMAAQPKRSVLTAIDGNKAVANLAKGKQPLQVSQGNGLRLNVGGPVVPVAQFKAFKVWEEDDLKARLEKKLRQLRKSNACNEDEKMLIMRAELELKKEDELRKLEQAELDQQRRQEQTEIDEQRRQEQMELEQQRRQEQAEMDVFTSQVVEATTDGEGAPPECPMSVELTSQERQMELAKLADRKCRDAFFEGEDYRMDVIAYLREHEKKYPPKPGYILKQHDVTESMRAILVDWLVEVAEEYKMQTETLYLAVNYIDRFLSYMAVIRAKLQLVGTAAMFVASKFEEIYPPDVTEFVYITDDTYTKEEVLRMEKLILKVLQFNVSSATPCTFINAFSLSTMMPDKTKHLALYLSELSLMEVERLLQFLPSTIACSAIALANHTLGEQAWPQELIEITSTTLEQLKPCVNFLYEMFKKAPDLAQTAIHEKYKHGKYGRVSAIEPPADLSTME